MPHPLFGAKELLVLYDVLKKRRGQIKIASWVLAGEACVTLNLEPYRAQCSRKLILYTSMYVMCPSFKQADASCTHAVYNYNNRISMPLLFIM